MSRSTATSTCICERPERSCSPVCGSRRMTRVGSSSLRRRRPVAIFSSSPFAFGVIAKLITGSGKSMCGGSTGTSWSTSTSPVTTSLSFATAPRSPIAERVDRLGVLPLQQEHLAEPLLRVRARVDERRVARDGPGEDAEEADAAGERVGDRLEDEDALLRVAELDRRALARRRRDALDEQVEERGRAEILRGDAAARRDRARRASRRPSARARPPRRRAPRPRGSAP